MGKLSEEKNIHILGRVGESDGDTILFWTGSGIEMNIAASELWVEFISEYSVYEPWICIEIDGFLISRLMLTKGRHNICIFRNMNTDIVKHIRIMKESQAMSDDDECMLKIGKISHDGNIFPLPKKPLKIEFIGDSITSGEGTYGAKCESDWVPMIQSASQNYAVMTADRLNADFRIISQSGWGVLSSWDNNPYRNITDYYEKVCGVVRGYKNHMAGCDKENNFSAWKADIIVINLGTNDESAFHQPQWTDGKICFKQWLDNNGNYYVNSIKKFNDKAKELLRKVRKYNPNSYIIWAFGMLGNRFMPYIEKAIQEYSQEEKDDKICSVSLEECDDMTVGAAQHPGRMCHEQAAQTAVEFIKRKFEYEI